MVNIARNVVHFAVRHNRRLIWEADLRAPRTPSQWAAGEQVTILGPDNVDREMTPALRDFLIATSAASELEGVRRGDRLFVIKSEDGYLAYSYIFFDTTKETRRQAIILAEMRNTPIVGLSYTAPSARGRGLYQRILNDMFRFLHDIGPERAVCEVDPRNVPSNRASEAAGMRVCRQLSDWTILRWIVFQKVWEARKTRWRIFWIGGRI
jgi:RimJ/RimL family protein N-acetyltransferase